MKKGSDGKQLNGFISKKHFQKGSENYETLGMITITVSLLVMRWFIFSHMYPSQQIVVSSYVDKMEKEVQSDLVHSDRNIGRINRNWTIILNRN